MTSTFTNTGEQPEQDAPAERAAPEITQNWNALVERIQRDDASGMEELYKVFSRGIRYYLCRQLGPQDLDDKVHDCYLIVVQAIRRGDLREPERLMGFVRTIVRRQIAGHIDTAVHTRQQQVDLDFGRGVPDRTLDPEATILDQEKADIASKVLQGVSRRDREILTRFYLHEQSQDQICREMKLSETQFRLLKSRAKARFGELGKSRITRRSSTILSRVAGGR